MAKPWENYVEKREEKTPENADLPWDRYETFMPETGGVTPAAAAAVPEDAPTDDAPPGFVDEALHVAAGIPQAGVDILNLPSTLAKGVAWVDDFLYGAEGLSPGRGDASTMRRMMLEMLSQRTVEADPLLGPAAEVLAAEQVTREEAPVADALRTSLEWGAGGLYRLAQKVAGKAATVLPDILMGGAAGAGQYAGGDTGELIGGVGGLLLALRTGDFSKLSKAEQNALEALIRNADDPAQALKNLEDGIASGEIGTLADLTKDEIIYDIEQALSQSDAAVGRRIAERATERELQAAGRVEASVGGTRAEEAIEVAQEAAARRGERIQRGAETRAGAQTAAAEQAQETSRGFQAAQERLAETTGREAAQATRAVESTARPAEVSTEFAGRLDTLDDMLRETVENPAWEAFKRGPRVDPKPLQAELDEYIKALVPEEQKILRQKYGPMLRMINDWDRGGVKPQSIQAVLSQMKDATRSASQAGTYGSAEKFLSDLIGVMDDALVRSNPGYAKAREATLERIRRTGGEGVGKARRTAEPEKLIRTLGLSDESGAVMLRRLDDINDPKARKLIGEQLRVLARKEGVDEKFLEKYGDVLDGYPEMRQQMEYVARKNKEAMEVAGNTKQAIKEQEAFRKGVEKDLAAKQKALQTRVDKLSKETEKGLLATFGRAPRKTIRGLLSSSDNIPQLTRLYQGLRRQGGGEGFKAAVRDELMQKLATPTTEGGKLKPGAFAEFGKIRDNLVAADILTGAQADEIAITIARQLDSRAARAQAISRGIENPQGELDRLLASGAAAATMQVTPGGQSLILAGAVRRAFMHMLKRKIGDAELRGMEEFILDPQRFLAAAQEADSIDTATARIIEAVTAAGQVAATGSEEE